LWDIISPGRWRVQYSFVSGKLAEGFLMGMIRESVWTAVGVGRGCGTLRARLLPPSADAKPLRTPVMVMAVDKTILYRLYKPLLSATQAKSVADHGVPVEPQDLTHHRCCNIRLPTSGASMPGSSSATDAGSTFTSMAPSF
jgi:hypothetical protein